MCEIRVIRVWQIQQESIRRTYEVRPELLEKAISKIERTFSELLDIKENITVRVPVVVKECSFTIIITNTNRCKYVEYNSSVNRVIISSKENTLNPEATLLRDYWEKEKIVQIIVKNFDTIINSMVSKIEEVTREKMEKISKKIAREADFVDTLEKFTL